MKIDIFIHIAPEKYCEAACKKYSSLSMEPLMRSSLDIRLRTMERTPEV